MQMNEIKIKGAAMLLLVVLFSSACSSREAAEELPTIGPIGSGDSCHVCGMSIVNFPGPKGQAFIHHHEESLKFCSTQDLFSWLLQPETAAILRVAYVHDMGATGVDWQHPSEANYVAVEEAWYVVGSDQMGAMGPTLASFAQRSAAEAYQQQHGGQLKRYAEIDLALLAANSRGGGMSMKHGGMDHAH